jgi:hypothetical protein
MRPDRERNKKNREMFFDPLKMRLHVLKLHVAQLAHLLHVGWMVDPTVLVKSGMRGIAFLLNQLAPLPPEMR